MGNRHGIGLSNVLQKTPVCLFRCLLSVFSITVLLCAHSTAQERVAIGLKTHDRLTTLLFSPMQGGYALTDEHRDTVYRFRTDDALSITANAGRVVVKSIFGLNDTLAEAHLTGTGINPAFKVRYNSSGKEHSYHGHLTVVSEGGRLRAANSVGMESYVGRVVQAEVGYGATDEYYKIQSIICRTYAVRNMGRHSSDGFNLCDHEHCQVYSGRKTATDEVVKAAAATSGLVMVSSENDLVLSAFHANCGGQTANSEDVWAEWRSYLRAATDTFCLSERSATWSRVFDSQEFIDKLGFSTSEEDLHHFAYYQPIRKKYFTLGNDSVELGSMRWILHLRSGFFNLRVDEGQVIIDGRGYGHGVGLCQQGAMRMTEYGYDHSQILGYYYKGVSLISLQQLD